MSMFPYSACGHDYRNDCGNGSRLCGVVCESEPVYRPRRAEEGVLYGVVRENLETFLQRQEQRGRIVPLFVERELRSFLECGILALDGVYVTDEDGDVVFRRVPPPSDAEVMRIAGRISRRVGKLLRKHALDFSFGPEEPDPFNDRQPLLAELYRASIAGRIATGPRAGHRVARVRNDPDFEGVPPISGSGCASVSGFGLHAAVCVPARDRMRLERLCRYAGRPAIAAERLVGLADGRLLYRLKKRWRDGTTHVIFEPMELMEKLAALVPPPRFNMVRNHGVLAPSAAWRRAVVPAPQERKSPSHPDCPGEKRCIVQRAAIHPRNYSWAELMKRVFSIDVLECPRCKGRMRILCAINPPEAIRKILDCFGLPSRPPPLVPARLADQFDYF